MKYLLILLFLFSFSSFANDWSYEAKELYQKYSTLDELDKVLEEELRASPYPDTNITTNPQKLEGYSHAMAFMDYWYETGNPLEYKPKNDTR